MRLLLASQFIKLVDEHFNLRRGCPVLHANPVDNRVLLDMLFLLLNIRLLKVDRQGNVAAGTINGGTGIEGLDIILGASTTKLMTTARSDCFLSRFIANTANENILAILRMLLQDQVRMISNLTHLHDETEDVSIVVQHDTSAHISIELSSGVGHYALGKVAFNLAEKFVMQDNTILFINQPLIRDMLVGAGTDRLGGSSIAAVWSRFTRLSIILSVIRRSFPNASFRISGSCRSVTGSR